MRPSAAGRSRPPPVPAEKLALAAEQLRALVAAKGDHGLLIARKHMGWTCNGFAGAPQLRHALMRAPTPADALALLEQAQQALAAAASFRATPAASPGGSATARK
jgi:tRNA-dihydrouridine synthase B